MAPFLGKQESKVVLNRGVVRVGGQGKLVIGLRPLQIAIQLAEDAMTQDVPDFGGIVLWRVRFGFHALRPSVICLTSPLSNSLGSTFGMVNLTSCNESWNGLPST